MTSSLVTALGALLLSVGSPGAPAADKSVATAKAQYRIDPSKSRLIVETQTSALSLMFAHDHRIEADSFSGVATFSRRDARLSSVELTVHADSLRLLDDKSVAAGDAIEAVLREDVLEVSKYPDIGFKTRSVTSERRGDGSFDVRLTGELSLHGVRRTVIIPARVALEASTLHAIGVFEIRQTDFKINPFSFVKGSVVIKDNVAISFDIVATQTP